MSYLLTFPHTGLHIVTKSLDLVVRAQRDFGARVSEVGPVADPFGLR